MTGSLSLFSRFEPSFNDLHNAALRMTNVVILQFPDICLKFLDFDDRVVSLRVVEAAEPHSDIMRIGNFVSDPLVAGDLGDIDGWLCPNRPGGGE